MASADDFKNQGNEFLKKGDLDNAIKSYSSGINIDPNNYILYSNRGTAYLQQHNYQSALEDSQKTVSLNPSWAKGYLRSGQALYGLGQLKEAVEILETGLQKQPDAQTSAQIQKTLNEVNQKLQQQQSNPLANLFDENMWGVIASNPQLQPLLADQDFVNKLKLVQQNPQLMNTYMQQDQRFMNLVLALLQARGVNAQMADDEDIEKNQRDEEDRKRRQQEEEERKKKDEEERLRVEEEATKLQNNPAALEKEKGNAFFVKKQYQEALNHYLKAQEFDPQDMVYKLNAASCLIELGKLDEGIKTCEEAIELGKKHHADYQLIAKALARIGNAYFKKQDYKQAVYYYAESLTEHRNRDIVQRKLKAEQLMRKKEELEYINPDVAEQHRQKGNELFKQMKYPEAMKEYNEAVKRNPTDAKLYVNRATTYIKLATFPYALKDTEKAIELDQKYVKAYARKGQCHFALKEYHKAIETYDIGLAIEPENQELKQGKAKVTMVIAQSGSQRDEERVRRAASDPEIQSIINDPMMRQILNDMSTDSQAAQHHLKNPQIAEKINKLIAAGVLQVS
jgi:stress-induced-phosphoprotein 1